MDELITELERWTEHMLERLDSAPFEEIAELVVQRQSIIDRIQNQIQARALTLDDQQSYRARVRRLLAHDNAILNRLEQLRQEASGGMQKISVGRKQTSAYNTTYTPTDGAFFDEKN